LAASLSYRVATTLLDLVEEPFDQVAHAIQIRAEADQVFAISQNPKAAIEHATVICLPNAARLVGQHRPGRE
jgi:hypothetical protein